MKIKFTDNKRSSLIFRDSSVDEDEYERLLKRSYKGEELSELYDTPLYYVFDTVYKYLNYPVDDEWFIAPEILKDDAKMKELYNIIREDIVDKLNDDLEDLEYKLNRDDFNKIKEIFNIRYSFRDDDYYEDIDESELSEDYKPSNEKPSEENEDISYVGKTCQEFLKENESKIEKDDPKYYLLKMALNEDKGWAYIKKVERLKGDIELDVVTPKNVKKLTKYIKE